MATTKAPEPPATDGGGIGDDDYTKNVVEQPHTQVLPAPQEDYPVERVEAVYRKLDMRIIPGIFTHMCHTMSHCVTSMSLDT